jgi:uncharacterized protein YuzE
MRMTYDPEADALYIELRQAMPTDSRDIDEGVTADLDPDGHMIGIEVLHVRERLGQDALTSVVLKQLPLTVTHEGKAQRAGRNPLCS